MHVIRLRQPWQTQILPGAGDFVSSLVFSRKFHAPTGIENAQLSLVLRLVDAIEKYQFFVSLNQHLLSSDSHEPTQLESTYPISQQLLTPFNLLEIQIPTSEFSLRIEDVIGSVELVIR